MSPATILAADLIQECGSPADAIEWLEDQLARCDDQDQAVRWCDLIDATEAMQRGRAH